MKDQAVTPQALPILEIYGKMKKEQEVTFDALKEQDEKWKEFGTSSYYEMIKKYIDGLIAGFDELENTAFESGATLDEIGLRRVVNRLVKSALQSLTTKVNGSVRQPTKPAGPQPTVS